MSKADLAKQACLRELELSRLALHRDFQLVQDEFNVAKKVKRVVARRPLIWLGGATLLGFALAGRQRSEACSSGLFRRKKPTPAAASVQAVRKITFWGFLFGIFKMLLPFLKPVANAYASKRLAEIALSLNK
jgi:hypothetical protein